MNVVPQSDQEIVCALLWGLVAHHDGKRPFTRDKLVATAGLDKSDIGRAKELYDEVIRKRLDFVVDCGVRGVYVDPLERAGLYFLCICEYPMMNVENTGRMRHSFVRRVWEQVDDPCEDIESGL